MSYLLNTVKQRKVNLQAINTLKKIYQDNISVNVGHTYQDIQVHGLIKRQNQLNSKILFVSAIALLVSIFNIDSSNETVARNMHVDHKESYVTPFS